MAVKFDRLMSVFQEALEKHPPLEWDGFVREAAGDDEELYGQACQLLHAHAYGDSLLDKPAVAASPTITQPVTEKPGTQIGPYKLRQQIGEGGMGVVYMAEQKEPVERRVALKIIKPGMDTRQVIARFEAERQALAMMDHPNIAKVLDAGTTDSGRPYFVMELVNGISVTQFCDEQHLTARERLDLFVPICQAVQHAHQKGIIHRDIKPGNILVALYDGRPVPRVIDFGVAKATGGRLTDKTMFTELGQIVGTLEYMSPEQANRNQLDIDTRSDVYSLGVVLYELLTGDTPFDRQRLRSAAIDELLRIIREEEPPRPSTKLSSSDTLPSVAANRHIEPAKLSALVRGELDWIVMKALDKDRARRYETASKFAEDVQHYLNDDPVSACPPSTAYRFRKFARRNKGSLAAASMVAAALLIGLIGTTWQAVRASKAERLAQQRYEHEQVSRHEAEQQRDRATAAEELASAEAERANREANSAKTEAAIAQAVNDFLNVDLLAQADPENEPDRDIKLRTVVDRAAEDFEERFTDQPLVEAAIRHTLARTYRRLGEFEKAERQAKRALEIRRHELGPEHPSTLNSMMSLANTINKQGNHVEAETLYREVLEVQKRVLRPEHSSALGTMMNLANAIHKQRRHPEAETLYREVLEVQTRVSGPEHPSTLKSMMSLANAIHKQGNHAEAEMLYREVLEAQTRVLRPKHPSTLGTMMNLANAINKQGNHAEAETLYREVLEVQQRVLGPEHPSTLKCRKNLIANYMSWSRKLSAAADPSDRDPDKAAQLAEAAIKLFPEPDKRVLADWGHLGQMLYRAGRFDEARESLEKVIELRADNGPSLNGGPRWWYYTMTLWQLGETDNARDLFEQLDQILIQNPPSNQSLYEHLRAETIELIGEDSLNTAKVSHGP